MRLSFPPVTTPPRAGWFTIAMTLSVWWSTLVTTPQVDFFRSSHDSRGRDGSSGGGGGAASRAGVAGAGAAPVVDAFFASREDSSPPVAGISHRYTQLSPMTGEEM